MIRNLQESRVDGSMYYIVGVWFDKKLTRKYGFVYDTSDNSCELVAERDVKSLGVDIQVLKNPVNYTKLCMLYGLKPYKNEFLLRIIINDLIISNACYQMNLTLSLVFVDSNNFDDRSYSVYVHQLSRYYGYDVNKAMLLCLNVSNSVQRVYVFNEKHILDRSGINQVWHNIDVLDNNSGMVDTYSGIMIPTQMLEQLLRLISAKDFLKLRRICSNLFDIGMIADAIISDRFDIDVSKASMVLRG